MLAHTDRGTGNPIVFLHGYCENKSLWDAFTYFMSEHVRTVSVDLPGFGESPVIPNATIDQFADKVIELLNIKGTGPCVFVGHSMGGYVALAIAEKLPSIVRGLCLFHSTAYADNEEKKEARNKTIEFIERNGKEPFIETFAPSLFSEANKEKCAKHIQLIREMGLATPQEGIIEAAKAMRERPDRTEVLKKADYPVMFIVGKDDTAVPLESSMSQISLPPMSTVHFLDNTGHMGMLERTRETLQMLHAFHLVCCI